MSAETAEDLLQLGAPLLFKIGHFWVGSSDVILNLLLIWRELFIRLLLDPFIYHLGPAIIKLLERQLFNLVEPLKDVRAQGHTS
jgi:hypothetical protein